VVFAFAMWPFLTYGMLKMMWFINTIIYPEHINQYWQVWKHEEKSLVF
jgi:hypothetical protein